MDGVYGLFTSIPFENSTFSFHRRTKDYLLHGVKGRRFVVGLYPNGVGSRHYQVNANSISAAFLEYSLTDAMWLPQHVDLQ